MAFDLYHYEAKQSFQQQHLLCLQDYTPDEICQVLSLALQLKADLKAGRPHPYLAGKSLGMIFAKSSTRTRVSFEVGIQQLGGHGIFLSTNDIQLGRGEPIPDSAKVLSRFLDGIMIRTYLQSDVEGLATHGSIPIINGLTDDFHPCQVLADLQTIYEHKGALPGLKMAFVGDGFNMAHSLMIGGTKLGMQVAIACPSDYMPQQRVVDWCQDNVAQYGGSLTVTQDLAEAVRDADVIYTDGWSSMGQEEEAQRRMKAFAPYQVNADVMALARPDCMFLHCLPAHRGEEVTADVIDGPQSCVFDEAENRLHAQKAVMVKLMGGAKA